MSINGEIYKAVKNYIHNELEITKEDIQEFIAKEVSRIVTPELVNGYVVKTVDQLLKAGLTEPGRWGSSFRDRVTKIVSDEAGKFVAEQVRFDVYVKGEKQDITKRCESNYHDIVGTTRIND